MKFNPSFLLPIFILLCGTVTAQKQVLDNKMHHLRHGTQREWNDFPFKAEDSQLVMHFDVKSEILLGTISLRQFDISQLWQVSLNGRLLGQLTVDEKDMIVYFELPAGLLRTKDNLLEIRAKEGNDPEHPNNDIRIGQILLDSRPLNQILIEASVQVVIQDADQGTPLPSRLTITDRQGSLQPVSVAADDLIAARTGVIYTGNGRVAFSLPAGSYKLYASRGFEYGVDSIPLTLGPGDHVQKRLSIHHEVQAGNWIGCDPHIHTLTYSGHGDATIRERLLTIAGEGIAMPVMTDHNAAVVVRSEVEEMGLKDWITPVVGDEVTTSIGHFNIFPVDSGSRVPDYHVQDWNQLSDNIEMHKEVQVVILNHARDFHNGFKPFDPKAHIAIAGKSLRGWRFPANAMEVMNSGSQQTNPRQLYLDWMGMMNRGIFLAPVGSSDSHEVSRYLVGQARTYIRRFKADSARVNEPAAIGNFKEGRVSVSFGLLTEIQVDRIYGPGDMVKPAGNMMVSIKVMGPGWVRADHLVLYANGQKIRETNISDKTRSGIKYAVSWVLPKPAHDLFLVAVASGPAVQVPFWPIARPFQHESPELNPMVLGITGAIRIDADQDGRFTCAYDYAKALWASSGKNIHLFLKKLGDYDESVSIEAAAVLSEHDIDLNAVTLKKELEKAPSIVRIGFKNYGSALKHSNH